MAAVPLKRVSPDNMRCRVRVRAVRFYQEVSNEQPDKITKFEFVMLDEQGTTMEAVIPPKWIDTHKDSLKEDTVYMIQYFEVISAKATYRLVDHPYMARFTRHTIINEVLVPPENFPLYAYSIKPFASLHQTLRKKDQLSDVIGLFTKCTRLKEQYTRNGTKSMINVHITDGRKPAVLTLWGPNAQRFDAQALIEMGKNIPVVLLFLGVTADLYGGHLALQCAKTCKWYVNPPIPETALLQQSYGGSLEHPYWIGEENSTAPACGTVAELAKFTNPHDVLGNKYTVNGMIKEPLPNEPWWFRSCTTCWSTSKPDGEVYKCYNYTCPGKAAVPRYRLAFLVTDPDETTNPDGKMIEVIAFGSTGDQLTGFPVEALISDTAGVSDYVPNQITRLYGSMYEFHLSVPQAALQRKNTGFKIDSFTKIHTPSAHQQEPLTPVLPKNAATTPFEEATTSSLIVQNTSTFTPVEAVLDAVGNNISVTHALTKEKRSVIDVTPDGAALEDSDCETSQQEHKKPKAARKLSLVSDDEDGDTNK